jgi:ferredoxin
VTLVALIDPNICTAHGDCEEIAPEVFRVEDEVAVVIGTGPDELLTAAAEGCPTSAIRIVERETRKQLYP